MNPYIGKYTAEELDRMIAEEEAKSKASFKNTQVAGEYENINPNLKTFLEGAPDPIKYNSGFRTPEENARVGGVPNSKHLTGDAFDMTMDSMTPANEAYFKSNPKAKIIPEPNKNHYHGQAEEGFNPYLGRPPEELDKMIAEEQAALAPKPIDLPRRQNNSYKNNPLLGFGAGLTQEVPGTYAMAGMLKSQFAQPIENIVNYTQGGPGPVGPIESFKQGYGGFKKQIESVANLNPKSAMAGRMFAAVPEYATGMGALGKGGKLAQLGKGALTNVAIGQGERGRDNTLGNAAIDAAAGAAGEGIGMLGSKVLQYFKEKPAKLVNEVLNTPLAELDKGRNIGQEIVDRNIYGSAKGLFKKGAEGVKEFGDEGALGKAIEKAGNPKINEDTILNHLIDQIDKYKSKAGYEDYVEAIEKEAEKFLNDPKYRGIDAKKATQFKRDYAQLMGEKNFLKEATPASVEAKETMRKAFQNAVEEMVPETGPINKELGIYTELKKLSNKLNSKESKGSTSLFKRGARDILGSAAGAAIGGPIGGGLGFLGGEALNTTAGKTGSAIAYKYLAKLLEEAGKQGISPRNVGPIIQAR